MYPYILQEDIWYKIVSAKIIKEQGLNLENELDVMAMQFNFDKSKKGLKVSEMEKSFGLRDFIIEGKDIIINATGCWYFLPPDIDIRGAVYAQFFPESGINGFLTPSGNLYRCHYKELDKMLLENGLDLESDGIYLSWDIYNRESTVTLKGFVTESQKYWISNNTAGSHTQKHLLERLLQA